MSSGSVSASSARRGRPGGTLRQERLPQALRELGRDELRAVCRGHGLPDGDRHRDALIERIARAAGLDPATAVPQSVRAYGVPERGQIPRPTASMTTLRRRKRPEKWRR